MPYHGEVGVLPNEHDKGSRVLSECCQTHQETFYVSQSPLW